MTTPIWSLHQSPSPPRCSVPRRSLCLVSGSATAATVPRQTRLVPHCNRSTNAARATYPNPSGLVEALHIVFIPPAAIPAKTGTSLLPFAVSVAPWAFFTSASEAPTTSSRVSHPSRPDNSTFRSVGQTTLPCLQCRQVAQPHQQHHRWKAPH